MPKDRPGRHRLDEIQDPEDPHGSRTISLWVPAEDLNRIFLHSRWRFYNLHTAYEILRSPKRIYSGIRETKVDSRSG
ncbi:MAG: hypothetical protein HYY18_10740 [Planctomycetes bacterium]|nr:hypothetical protein [Planctomycetota bacterium]